MTINITPIDPQRPDFAGEVAGVDLRQPMSAADVSAIDAGMDRFAVLVFRKQSIDNGQQIAFTRHFGPIEQAYGVPGDNVQVGRLPSEINDISNLDSESKLLRTASDPIRHVPFRAPHL